jgi:hypothetical protein
MRLGNHAVLMNRFDGSEIFEFSFPNAFQSLEKKDTLGLEIENSPFSL